MLNLHRCFSKHLQFSLILLVLFGFFELVFKLLYLDISDHVLSLVVVRHMSKQLIIYVCLLKGLLQLFIHPIEPILLVLVDLKSNSGL